MNVDIVWEKLLFSSKYQFQIKNEKVGKISFNSWKNSATGELLNRVLTFKTKGIFIPRTRMVDTESGLIFGSIKYHSGFFRNSATIIYDDKTFEWKQRGFWSSKFDVTDGDGVRISGKTNKLKGIFETTNPEVPLVLSTIIINRYYRGKNTLFSAAVALPPVLTYLM